VLQNKVRDGLVGIFELESGGLLVFKMIPDIVIDVEDNALRSLAQSLQKLRLTDVPGENVGTAVNYFKGALMLLQNCDIVPTDMIAKQCDMFSRVY